MLSDACFDFLDAVDQGPAPEELGRLVERLAVDAAHYELWPYDDMYSDGEIKALRTRANYFRRALARRYPLILPAASPLLDEPFWRDNEAKLRGTAALPETEVTYTTSLKALCDLARAIQHAHDSALRDDEDAKMRAAIAAANEAEGVRLLHELWEAQIALNEAHIKNGDGDDREQTIARLRGRFGKEEAPALRKKRIEAAELGLDLEVYMYLFIGRVRAITARVLDEIKKR